MTDEQEKDYYAWRASLPAPTNKPKACQHDGGFGVFCAVTRLEDVQTFCADLRIVCLQCHEPFRFRGMDPGFSPRVPRCSIDGLVANLPIEPEVEHRLLGGASFEVPQRPTIMKPMTTYYTPADAIARSISHSQRTDYPGPLADLIAYAKEQGYEVDWVVENDGSYDVWGWTDETPENEQEWRVRVVVQD